MQKASVLSRIRLLMCTVSFLLLLFHPFFIAKESNKIVIYHTNDMHGNVNSVYTDGVLTQIGLDIIKNMKETTPNSLLIDAGDAIQGSPLAKYSNGMDIIKLMNEAGYDCATIGNHEFDFGSEAVKKCVNAADFPIISANIYENGELFLKGAEKSNGKEIIKEINGLKIGFFGITTSETTKTTIPENLKNLEFRNELQTTKQEIEELKSKGVDLTIGIMHVGETNSGNIITSDEIAKATSGIDIIIDGHSHTKTTKKVNSTVIAQTGVNSTGVGKIQIDFDDPKNISINSQILSASEIGRDFTPDKSTKKLYDNLYSNFSDKLERVIGRTETALYGGSYGGVNISRFLETNLGDLICDAMMEEGKKLLSDTEYSNFPVVAFENGGAVRAKINPGYIKVVDVINTLPLDNKLSVQIITPNKLYEMIERGVGKIKREGTDGSLVGPFGGFPQISGMEIEFDISKLPYNYETNSPGERVTNISIIEGKEDSKKIKLSRDDNTSKIVLLCNDYTLCEFPSIMNEKVEFKGRCLSEILCDYISKITVENNGKFSMPIDGQRVKMKENNGNFKNYNGEIIVKNGSGILRSCSIEVRLDQKDTFQTKTDENGVLKINNLTSGQHILSLKYKDLSNEVYLNDDLKINNISANLVSNQENNVLSVSNIIGQIPYEITLDSSNILKFARNSYDSLSDSEKPKIMNYYKLQKSEERFWKLENRQDFVHEEDKIKFIFAIFIAIAIVLIAYVLYKKFYKKKLRTRIHNSRYR